MADTAGERFARGMETVAKLFPPGSSGVPRFQYPPEIANDWGQLSVSTVMGDVWGRPGLEMKSRAMITIAMLTALGRLEQLKAYIVGGLNLGLTRSEVCEVIYQVAVYAGFPAAIQGFAIANEVFAELDRGLPDPDRSQRPRVSRPFNPGNEQIGGASAMTNKQVPKPDFISDEDWKLLMDTRDVKTIRAWGAEHTRRYLESGGGDESGSMIGMAVILITTIGRKSGEERTNPVNFVQEGETIYVVGSLSGLEQDPFWALNLEQTPRGWVQMKDRRWAVKARKITDEKERAELWPRLTAKFPMWGHFQKYSERQFKVFELTPA